MQTKNLKERFMCVPFPNYLTALIILMKALFISTNLTAASFYSEKTDSSATYTAFMTSVDNDKVYLNWKVKNQSKDGYYIIEKSYNNDAFEYAGHLNREGINSKDEVVYSFIDNASFKRIIYYRIIHINFDGELAKSKTFKVNSSGKVKAINSRKVSQNNSKRMS